MKKSKDPGFLRGLALGILLGFILSTVTLWIIDSSSEAVEAHWPEQMTHLVTLVAAGLALWGVAQQIQHNVELKDIERRARLDAALSSLPIVLSNLVRTAELRYHAMAHGDLEMYSADPNWVMSDFELSTLRDCIEHATGREKFLLQQIIRIYQVLMSRWRASEDIVNLFSAPAVGDGEPGLLSRLEQFYSIRGWMVLRATCNALFDFSRGAGDALGDTEIKKSVLFTLRHISDGGVDGSSGWALANNQNYYDFVARQNVNKRMIFVDDEW